MVDTKFKPQERYKRSQLAKGHVKVTTWVPAGLKKALLKVADMMRKGLYKDP